LINKNLFGGASRREMPDLWPPLNPSRRIVVAVFGVISRVTGCGGVSGTIQFPHLVIDGCRPQINRDSPLLRNQREQDPSIESHSGPRRIRPLEGRPGQRTDAILLNSAQKKNVISFRYLRRRSAHPWHPTATKWPPTRCA
jgi:hypothetical protein